LYVDKNLRYHGLIQAYSRTNRLLNSDKPHGNIVSFRNLKEATDKALKLFGDENARDIVFKKPYEEQKKEFDNKLVQLFEKVPTLESVDDLKGEEEKAGFVQAFRDLLRIKSSLETYAEFSFENLNITEQEFYDYQSKYLDIYEERKKNEKTKESILDQIDFEIELTVRDIINFDYIIQLIAGLKDIKSDSLRKKKIENILNVFDRDIQLRKKKDLIEKFIKENLPNISPTENIEKAFGEFWAKERIKKIKTVSENENISVDKLEQLMGEYIYSNRLPKGQDIVDMLPEAPRIIERQGIIDRVKGAIGNIIDIFEW
jgi:type I restriction enzyme R subunit